MTNTKRVIMGLDTSSNKCDKIEKKHIRLYVGNTADEKLINFLLKS